MPKLTTLSQLRSVAEKVSSFTGGVIQTVVDALEEMENAKADVSNVLTKTNATAYTPSASYHPATKKYVDDKAANIPAGNISGTLAVSKGGTGATTAAAARSSLGVMATTVATSVPTSVAANTIVFVVEG